MTSRTLARKAARFAFDKKAFDVSILDLRKLTSVTDFFVVCSADSTVQVKAVADAIEEGLERQGERAWHKEGYGEATWIVIDFVNVVVHVFRKDTRAYYGMEKLWGDAKTEEVLDVAPSSEKAGARSLARRKGRS